ncbi:hypothetical protein VQH23_14965 [Pararoseomonas sp. SCSIO 73927]|uniref:hypothetical protein n=1 Tax=Pararoseomonas sp. SCSIO 73927 TaxID=3114537 RepID=UPI0030D3E166
MMLRDAARLVPAIRRLQDARNALARERDELAEELRLIPRPSPFFHYNAVFDPLTVLMRHAQEGLQPRPGHVTNFLGVQVDTAVLPEILGPMAGTVEGLPNPANWHADLAEFGAALRAVELARERFTVVELGCGWGCWLNITGVAARRAGLDVALVGVEGDESHLELARKVTSVNGFTPDQLDLQHGVAAAVAGTALFPVQGVEGGNWGLEPVFGATDAQREEALRSGSHTALPMLPMSQVLAPYARVDLLHVDIQGGEVPLIEATLDLLSGKVAYLLIGTHSRPIEGRLFELLSAAGWRLEVERPAILNMHDPVRVVTVDGVQGWRNPALVS